MAISVMGVMGVMGGAIWCAGLRTQSKMPSCIELTSPWEIFYFEGKTM